MAFTEKERLLKVLKRENSDRPPVICPGGMMSALTVDILDKYKIDGKLVNLSGDAMTKAAKAARNETGMENLGVPFCLTCEAEALGASVSLGTNMVEPMVMVPVLKNVGDIGSVKIPEPEDDPRLSATIIAIRNLKQEYPHIPVIGNVTGPVTLASSLIDFEIFGRIAVRNKPLAGRIIDTGLRMIKVFIGRMAKAGADVIAVSDPTANGEIFGPERFRDFLPYYVKLFSHIRALGLNSILHICGDISLILPIIPLTGADALSIDSMLSVAATIKAVGEMPVAGNVSTQTLYEGSPDAVVKTIWRLVKEGTAIITPGCGIDRNTPLRNLRAMTDAVKELTR
jgi:[methyl-Co(III) methanol-specific corrinoid protein]:coenzyme M methyltransferase